MPKPFQYIILLCILMCIAFKANAQLNMPDTACIGAVKHYNVNPDPIPGSLFTWRIDGVTQTNSTTHEIDILWSNAGNYLLEVEELSADGCPGAISSGFVVVNPGPAISCPVNMMVSNSSYAVVPNPEVSDYCGIASITNNFNGGNNASGNYPSGSTIVTFTVTDIYGNSSTCSMVVSIFCDITAYNDDYTLAMNSTYNLSVGSNDSLCGQTFPVNNITILNQPENFILTVNPVTGQILITPPLGYTGTDSLLYKVCYNYSIINEQGGSEIYTVCDSAWAVIHIFPLPTAHIAGSATICNNGMANLVVTLTGTPPYTIKIFDGTQESIYTGIMSNYFNIVVNPTVTTTYTITQVQDATSLTAVGTGSAILTVIGPQAFILTGGGSVCPGAEGLTIGLTGSETGMNYTLYLNGSSISGPIPGNGNPLNFGSFNLPGIYTVISSSLFNSCTFLMYSNAVITTLPAPTAYTVTGGGSCCFGCTSIHVGLSQSEQGVWYQLYLHDTILVSSAPGTGFAIDFGYVTESGFYTVTATNGYGCKAQMTGPVEANIFPRPEGYLVSQNQTICAGSYFPLVIDFNDGTAPYCIGISDGSIITTYCDINCSPYIINVSPAATTTYSLMYVNDANNCSGQVGGTTTIIVTPCASFTITGQVTYDNSSGSPLPNVLVTLKQNNIVIDTSTTTSDGMYEFINLYPGTYTIEGSTSLPWGGVNATDALLIMQHFTGIITLSGLKVLAADVDNHKGINSIDALLTAMRFVGLINSFPAGDWLIEKTTLSLNNSDMTYNIKALCFGDVNGSYQLPGFKQPATINLLTSGNLELTSFENFDLPLQVTQPLKVSALSLILSYPKDILGITSVNIGETQSGVTQFNTENGFLRISWYDLKEMSLATHDNLLRIHFRTKDLSKLKGGNIDLNLDGSSEASDKYGEIIQDVNLVMPKLIVQHNELSLQVIPNPLDQNATFLYTIPEDARVTISVYNMLGNIVKRISEGVSQRSGIHQYYFDASAFPQGVYIYKLIVEGNESQMIKGRFVITH